jgi:two-component system, NarL family, response regulator LiaR
MDTHTITIVVVEDHIVTRNGICQWLRDEPQLKVVGEAGDGIEAIQIVNETAPDVVLMDISLPKMNGIEATREIKKNKPNTAVIAFTAYDDDEYIFSLLDTGAAGYLIKTTDKRALVNAIRAVYAGEPVLSTSIINKVIVRLKQQDNLRRVKRRTRAEIDNRQKEILRLAAKGISNEEIAKQLDIGRRTVANDLRTIYKQFRVGSRTEAVLKAIKEGWLDINDISTE